MFYHESIKSLIAEAKKGIQFKDMNLITKILYIIGLSPLIVSTTIVTIYYYVAIFFYKAISLPLEKLHLVLKEEAKNDNIKHATQCVIYLIGFPIIFFMYFLQAVTTIYFYFLWFAVMLNMYLVTLGGVRFQPFLTDAKFECEYEYELKPSLLVKYIYIGLVLIFMFVSLVLIVDYSSVSEDLLPITSFISMLLLIVVNPILFRKKQVTNNVEEIKE